jgi:ABC-2 type transport system permease protein
MLMAALFIVPVWLATNESDEIDILVVDDSYLFSNVSPKNNRLEDTESIHFHLLNAGVGTDSAKSQMLASDDFDAVLVIHSRVINTTANIQLLYEKQPSLQAIRYIENSIESDIAEYKLYDIGVNAEAIERIRKSAHVSLVTKKIDEIGDESDSSTELSMIVGMFSGILIYMFIFLYGVQVMRGVIEEKTSRIIEVIISSVKPFELMMGKIVGIALVGLTQFLLWTILSGTLITGSKMLVEDHFADQGTAISIEQAMSTTQSISPEVEEQASAELNQEAVDELFASISQIDFPVILFSFLFYFLGGYLIYSALFAAVGSAVDSEADSQQFMLPITVPIIFSFVMAQVVINNPTGPWAFWLSMIPFTSPIIMMVRIPFGVGTTVPYWELGLSMTLLVIGFIATTWLAGRIYRTGILMYGKKISYKELWKWLRYH